MVAAAEPNGLDRAVDGVSGVDGVRLPTGVPPPFSDLPASGETLSPIILIGSLGHMTAEAADFFAFVMPVCNSSALIVAGSRFTAVAVMCMAMPSLDRESSSIFVSNELTLPALLPAPLLFLFT